MSPTAPRRTYRAPVSGERRRERLLEALQDLLGKRPLAQVAVADVARAAGVTRSAFYFYFPSKEAAVGELLSSILEEMAAANWDIHGPGLVQREMESTLRDVRAIWKRHQRVILATLDASTVDPEVRATWDEWIGEFVDMLSVRIDWERAHGTAVPGPDAHALSQLLMAANVAAWERMSRRPLDDEMEAALLKALVHLWSMSIFGTPA